jgi:Fe-S cluster assembly protein SufD
MTVNVTPIRSPAENALIERFQRDRTSLPGNAAVARLREAAFRRITETGLPTRRNEAWKYTDLRHFMREAAPIASSLSAEEAGAAFGIPAPFAPVERTEICFANGYLHAMEAMPAGVTAVPMAKALAEGHPALDRLGALEITRDDHALSLNAAFMTDGVIITVAAGAAPELPLALRFVTSAETAVATALRVLVIVEAGASLTLLESHESQGSGHQPNTAVELVLGEGATVNHARLGANGAGSLALSTLTIDLGAKSTLKSLNVTASGAMARHQVFAKFSGEHVNFTANGTVMISGQQHVDNTLVVDHAAPHGNSRELFRTVVDGEATGVFQGKIGVRQIAQKTDGRMASNALLLSEGATMNNKPELEIFADDVACAHGATCGALDDDLLFYLMSRGIPRKEAEALMIASFLNEAIEVVEHEGVRDVLEGYVAAWLTARA